MTQKALEPSDHEPLTGGEVPKKQNRINSPDAKLGFLAQLARPLQRFFVEKTLLGQEASPNKKAEHIPRSKADGQTSDSVSVHDLSSPEVDQELQKKSFLQEATEEFKDILRLNWQILKNPKLIRDGFMEVIKDYFNLIRSLSVKGNRTLNEEEVLGAKVSQSLGISELVSFPGTILGIEALSVFDIQAMTGISQEVINTVGAIAGNYLSAVISFLLSYLLLTAKQKNYGLKKSWKDGLRVVKDCVPAAAALYTFNAPLMTALQAIGLSGELASGLVTIFGIIIFMGVAKVSASKRIDETVKVQSSEQ
ncbi:MAG: hypothetical protein V2A63_02030 [Patescibacteria group bacterium]